MPSRYLKFMVWAVGPTLGIALAAPQASSQTTLGNVGSITTASCATLNTDRGGFDSAYFTECHQAQITGCSNIDPIYFYYGIAPPANGTQALGTIVILTGLGGRGISSYFSGYVQAYTLAGYQVIEVVYGPQYNVGQDWEDVNTMNGGNTPNILNAACRPASLLNWVRNGTDPNQVGQGLWKNTGGGMCVHGDSAGAGGVGYTLSWYYGGVGGTPVWGKGFIDKAIMVNGPVFSNVQQGCAFTMGVNSSSTHICGPGTSGLGCGGSWTLQAPWPDYYLEYVSGAEKSVDSWSGGSASGACAPSTTPACGANTLNVSTCSAENTLWYNMSIVNFPATGQQPSFSYPSTGLSGYSCASVTNEPQNNAPAQAQLFFDQFTSTSQFANLVFDGSAGCPGIEKVEGGTVYNQGTNYPGQTAVIDDMIGTSPWNPQFSCGKLKRQ